MSEIEAQTLEAYKKLLAEKGMADEVVNAIEAELTKEAPNAERLVEILKRSKAVGVS